MHDIPTSKLHLYVQKLILQMREGMGRYGVAEAAKNDPTRLGKRYSPRSVSVRFVPGMLAEVNVAGFSFNAANGVEVERGSQETWMGSDGEPNYTQVVKFRGPVVTHWGFGKRGEVEVLVPTGLSDEHAEQQPDAPFTETPHRRAEARYSAAIAAGDYSLLNVLIDTAIAGEAFPVPNAPIVTAAVEGTP